MSAHSDYKAAELDAIRARERLQRSFEAVKHRLSPRVVAHEAAEGMRLKASEAVQNVMLKTSDAVDTVRARAADLSVTTQDAARQNPRAAFAIAAGLVAVIVSVPVIGLIRRARHTSKQDHTQPFQAA